MMVNRIGSTGQEVFQAWRALSELPQSSQHVVVGWIPAEGVYSWRHGEIVREVTKRAARRPYGLYAFAIPASTREIDRIHQAIDTGAFQVEGRIITGTLGYYTNPDAGRTVKVYHQATGRRLKDG